MKKTVAILVIMATMVSFVIPVYASDWDKFGKAMAGIEGIRILTGGNVDIIGTITGTKRDNDYSHKSRSYRRQPQHKDHRCERVWIPSKTVWRRKYIPEHKEYSEKYGRIIVEGHYIKYKGEEGGYWKECSHDHREHHHSRARYNPY